MSKEDRKKINKIVRRRAENGKVTTVEDLVDHDDLNLSERSIRDHLKKLGQEDRKDRIANVGDEGKTGYYVPADMTDEFPEDYEKWKKQSKLNSMIDKIEETRKELEKRICRQPTVEEIAEEMGKMPNEDFERLVRESVSEDWRSPDADEIERAKNEVQGKMNRCMRAFQGWTDTMLAPHEKEMKEYIENNRELLSDFEYSKISDKEDNKAVYRFEAPEYFKKFMREPRFTLLVSERQKN